MTDTSSIPRPWQAADIDRWMLLVVAGNVLVALWLGQDSGQMAVATPVAAVAALTAAAAVWRARGTLFSRLALSVSLFSLVAVQIHLAGGALQAHFNVYVSLSLLLAWRDWRPVAAMAGLFVVHHIGFNQMLAAGVPVHVLAAPSLKLIALDVALIAMHSGLLCRIAYSQEREARAARELDFLVNAMGRDGKIRLNLAVIKPETPVGERLHHVQQRMAAAVSAMQAASRSIEVAAEQVATGSGELMSRTVAAADGLKDSAMCLDQIGVIVQHNNEASSEARAMSTTAAGMADQGGRMVTDVVRTMQDIQGASRRITDIIGVIDGIAFQTNILALNAAVEAARAGEQGRGFAVVASEVRSLAQRSAAAAKEIKSLINSSSVTIDNGTRLVSGAGETMNQLVGSVRRVGELFQTVTADTAEQMHGLRTVSQSIRDLSEATQRNVGVAEQASAAAMDLRRQSACLAEALNAFNLGAMPAPLAALPGDAAPASTASTAPAVTAAAATPSRAAARTAAASAASAPSTATAASARTPASTGEVEYF